MIRFEIKHEYVEVKDNITNKIMKERLEYRKHPLTKETTRINVSRAKRPLHSHPVDSSEFKNNEKCLFCKHNLKKVAHFTTKPETIKKGEFVLFPNLYPFAKYHAVGILTEKHFMKLNEFKEDHFYNAFKTTIKWIKAISKKDKTEYASSINMNFMFPAAASQIHPHIQVTIDKENSNIIKKILRYSKEYHNRYWSNYWRDLIYEEKKTKERYITSFGNIHLIASFAPLNNNEITIVIEGRQKFEDLKKEDIKDLSKAITAILHKYHDLGNNSFNFSFFSPKDKDLSEVYYLFGLIGTRANINKYYSCDKGFMEVFHQEPIISTLPEDLRREFL